MWKRKRQANEQLTLIIIPTTTAKPYSLRFSRKYARLAGGAAGLLLIFILFVGIWFFVSRADIQAVNQLKSDNRQKQETIDNMEQEIKKIEAKQKDLQKRQNDLKKQMGLEKESSTGTGPSRGSETAVQHKAPDTFASRTESMKNQLAQQEKEVGALLATVNQRLAYYRSLPNLWPLCGEISSGYGPRKSPLRKGGGTESFHDGIDIEANSGTPVHASGDGTVIYSGWMAVYGRTIEIQHSCGLISKYGHNSSLLVKKGEQVKKGDVIAKVGSTGRSTGPHLHFTVYKGKSTQDPMLYLPSLEESI